MTTVHDKALFAWRRVKHSTNIMQQHWIERWTLLKHRSKNYMKGNSPFLYMSCYHKSFILDKGVLKGAWTFPFFPPERWFVGHSLCLMLLICCTRIWDGRAYRFIHVLYWTKVNFTYTCCLFSFFFCCLCEVVNLSFASYYRWSWASAFRMNLGDWW